jgi:hypothetical protein
MSDLLKNRYFYLLGSLIIAVIILLIVRFPYDIKVPCQIVGQKSWALIQVEPDKLISKTYDNNYDKTLNFTLLQFDREDFVQFQHFLKEDIWIYKDDPVAKVMSLDNQIRFANLSGELEKARDNLAIATAGEKEALTEEAERALELARIQFEAYAPQYQRNKELYKKNLISPSEWEITRATYDGYQSNIALQEARLEVMRTGEKDEIVRYMQDHVTQLQNQVQLMDTKMGLGDIRAPFDGIISYPSQDSVLCLIENTDSLLCKFPIPAAELKYVNSGQTISIRLYETDKEYEAILLNSGRRSKILNGLPVYIGTGYLHSDTEDAAPGMAGIAEVHCDAVSLVELLYRSFNTYVMKY